MQSLFSEIGIHKIITILRGFSLEEILNTASALQDGGIRFIEVTFNQKGYDEDTCNAIASLRDNFPGLHIGAGTVITNSQLEGAYKAGAEFIISPNTDVAIIRKTKELGMLSMPGAMTPSEIVAAKDAGADIVKLFPSDNLGPPYLKAISAPLNHVPLSAVGGVSLDNIQDFFKAGVYCVGIGSNIADRHAIKRGDFQQIQHLADSYVKKICVPCKEGQIEI